MNREYLRKKFAQAKNNYTNYIENRDAKSYEVSSLYNIDIINVATDFKKALDEFYNFKSTVSSITDDDTRFDVTTDLLEGLAREIGRDLSDVRICKAFDNIKYVSENIVFVDYQEKFKILDEECKANITNIEQKFKTYDDLQEDLRRYKNNRDKAVDENIKNDYKSRIISTEVNMERCLNDINTRVGKLEKNNAEMNKLLEKGLKKAS